MKKILSLLGLFLISCSTVKYVPVKENIIQKEYIRDTVLVYKPSKDSISVQTKDTVSRLETSLAVSEASISNGYLKHSIKNKDSLKVKIVYKDRIQEKIIEKPVEVYRDVYKTPKWVWYSLGLNLILLIIILLVWKFC